MTASTTKTKPGARPGFVGSHRASGTATERFYRAAAACVNQPSSRIDGRAGSLPRDWRNRLPDAEQYFRAHVENLNRPNHAGWSQGKCPFHDDRNASLSVHREGGWRCFANCGGGDLVGFHMKRTGLSFRAAVIDLIGGAR